MKGKTTFEKPSNARFVFKGAMGERIKANIDNWLLRAPAANPGMIEMFRLRDRKPKPDLVPWAGEFVGKYLISAIQARRMTDIDDLDLLIRRVIAQLIDCQAEDGYLGPFAGTERLLGHWDLWGHYHWMLALMMWHQDTGDKEALNCVIRAADLVCRTYLDTDLGSPSTRKKKDLGSPSARKNKEDTIRKVADAGSHEMNMAIIHVLGWLYRETGTERYFQMMRQIEREWQQAGDYFRAGLKGTEFYKTPKPRWESLHDVQGLVELYQITGDKRYRTAFENLWWSIQRHDRHNTGGFSTGEKAIGDPYAPGAIETCCTIAWMALTIDMLRLTGEPIAADELELSTWNSMMASQHPSGRWWTYDTPMDGVRSASAHSIVFQARPGTPELNCCSVNGPRGLGMLSEWAVMLDNEGVVVNYYGPMEADLCLPDGTNIRLTQETDYPADGHIDLVISPERSSSFNLRLRIPQWSLGFDTLRYSTGVRWSKETDLGSPSTRKKKENTIVKVNDREVKPVQAGSYLSINRTWRQEDKVEISLDTSLRFEPGERNYEGYVSIYRGPLLLAYDQHFNTMDPDDVPAIDINRLKPASAKSEGLFQPMVLLEVKAADDSSLYLCDFATAGAYGTHYRSWIRHVSLHYT